MLIINTYDLIVVFFSEDASKKHPFPCPTSYRTALLHYVDITSTVKTHVLRELAEYAKDEKEKEFLMNISDSTEKAKVCESDELINRRMNGWMNRWKNE